MLVELNNGFDSLSSLQSRGEGLSFSDVSAFFGQ